ncbi:M48 family metallopeptidase [Pasteurellaceae bacterium LIM206]|nr:M48 family metallopeptidase [Pasteurellaceae bacterium LIM206]
MTNICKKLAILSLSAALLIACATSEDINRQAASQYAQVLAKARTKKVLDTSSATAKRVHAVFNRIVPYADKDNHTGQKFNWQINVIRSKELNAWAMPGGKMVVYSGLVENLNLSDDEIAVVIGHEMAHALQEHSKKAQNVGVFTGIIGGVADIAASMALGVDTGGLATSAMDLGVDKPFSRSNETEADEIGLILMAKAGYNPQAAPTLWQKMQKASGSHGGSLLSTHPSDAARQANLQRLMPQAMQIYNASKH